LLAHVPSTLNARINEVLLTALLVAVTAWRPDRESAAVRIELEGHGREPLDATIDLTRTVGWFTTQFPVCLDPGRFDVEEALAGGHAVVQVLKQVKEQLRAVPNHGLGYGMLRYLDPEGAAALAHAP